MLVMDRRSSSKGIRAIRLCVAIALLFFHTLLDAKELQLPPCEEIPVALCGEGRIKSFCLDKCGTLAGDEKGTQQVLKTKPLKTTPASGHSSISWTTTRPSGTNQGSIESNSSSSEHSGSGERQGAGNETVRRHFLAPKPQGKEPKEFTLSPALQEEIDEFFNPTTRSNVSTTPVPVTSPRSTKNKTCNKLEPCVSLVDANRRFQENCQTSNPPMAPGCYGLCRYDVPLPELKNAFIRGICPVPQTRLFLTAASSFNDNTYCCAVTGVLAGRHSICSPFCFPNGPVWPDKREGLKYLPCLQSFEQIMRCHWAGLVP